MAVLGTGVLLGWEACLETKQLEAAASVATIHLILEMMLMNGIQVNWVKTVVQRHSMVQQQ